MLCHEFETVFAQAESGLPPGALAHLQECPNCATFVADFKLIQTAARTLAIPPTDAPEHVWSNLRAQLLQEGIINRPAAAGASWSDQLFAWLRHPVVVGAYAAVALLAIGLLSVGNPVGQLRPAEPVATASPVPDISRSLDTVETAAFRELHPDTSDADASLKRGLAVVDKFIAMCEKTVRENPQDETAREYLAGAYQQKSELLATVVEHGFAGE